MSSGSSDSESISECEFETFSESDKKSIRAYYNYEPEHSQEDIDKIKEKNGSVSEKEGSREDDTRLGNTTWCTCKNCKFCENVNEQRVLQMLSRRCSSIRWQAGEYRMCNAKCRFRYSLLKQTSHGNSMYKIAEV